MLLPLFLIFSIFQITVEQSEDTLPKAFNSLKIRKFNKNRLIIQRLKIGSNTKFVGESENCPKFMNFTACSCEPTCDNSNPLCINCQPGCVCRNGFVRNQDFLCVLPEECPNFEMRNEEEKYEAEPVVPIIKLTKKPKFVEPTTTVPLVIFRHGPTPPPSPPMLHTFPPTDPELIGAPSATPPPDFGPPGMTAERVNAYEKYLKERRIMRALRKRRQQRKH
ncbi:unnamed protein product [Caenorhabditis angaria]|uniref:TIL domain-containing protein n=1 Tax=Caenorhabditis angaria TaxID=860376 RepID=A0A9P1IUG7_9PELO|nr:unnamed protein product [Caenorhabditis angaria]